MKLRSQSDLNQHLADGLAWRKKELTTLKLLVQGARQHEQHVVLRAAVCLLYAHWEGFIKEAAAGYIQFVAHRDLRYKDLSPNFLALSLKAEIGRTVKTGRATAHTELAKKFLFGLDEKARLPWKNAVDTASNLNSKVLLDILNLLGLDPSPYLTKGHLIDQRLVDSRNKVSHGDRLPIGIVDYDDLSQQVITLVEQFRTDVENAAALKKYQRA